MQFYSDFKYQYTCFFNTLEDCVNASMKPKNSLQRVFIYSVQKHSAKIVRVIINGRVYGLKHARRQGFKNLPEFSSHQFKLLNNIKPL
jgi:hypothetical protein